MASPVYEAKSTRPMCANALATIAASSTQAAESWPSTHQRRAKCSSCPSVKSLRCAKPMVRGGPYRLDS